ncbi:RNA-directed DNA polymerase, eukaryota [Tanacetum coccineum]
MRTSFRRKHIYAPQQPSLRRVLWDYLSILLGRWNGEAILMGDYNEVRTNDERRGTWFNSSNASFFNQFISSSGLVDIKMEGYTFTWSHPSAEKMSKLDRFLVSDGILTLFPSITALCMDRHLSDHRPILLCEVKVDFGPIPFRFYHSWFKFDGLWINVKKSQLAGSKNSIVLELHDIDKQLDQIGPNDLLIFRRHELKCNLNDLKEMESMDFFQKLKVRWAIEGDKNSKYFHGIINKKWSHLAIRGVFDDGIWRTDPSSVKKALCDHYEARFNKPTTTRLKLSFPFPKRLSIVQIDDLERGVSHDEIRSAVWDCGDNKSPGPDGFTFEFFKKYWRFIGPDFCEAVMDAKFVNDYRPISLIGSVYKVVTKILANRLATVIAGLVSDTQSAFVADRQILDGPFILNEVLDWCKRKNKQAMFFKVDFAKDYDSVRWDFLIDVLEAFGFGSTWCNWIRGTFCYAKASILVNGSPSDEFHLHCGLKQCDPLSPYLFILVMESLHLSVSRAVDEGMFKGIRLHGSLSLSHLFFADDALFMGEWSDSNLRGIIYILKCFFLASGLKINIQKSQVLGVGVPRSSVESMASSLGCSIMEKKFRYLGVMVGERMSRYKAWDDVVLKLKTRLSKWKAKTLSIGGRLTLLKSVLGASPLYNMSIFKVPKGVLKVMESIRSNFFKGASLSEKKISWIAWDKVLASKKKGGLGVSSYFALNRALLLKWNKEFSELDARIGFCIDLSQAKRPLDYCSLSSSKVTSELWRFLCERGFGRQCDYGLPSITGSPTRWVKFIPIKINIFVWRARRDCLPTRHNLVHKGVVLESTSFPVCLSGVEDVHHILFRCSLAQEVLHRVCRWWEMDFQHWSSFSEWDVWFSAIRLPVIVKSLIECVFYVAWWFIWGFRNRSIFDDNTPSRSKLFEDIVSSSFLWCNRLSGP